MPANPVTESDREFASIAETLAATAILDGDRDLAAYLAGVADWHNPPSPHRSSVRVRLAMAGLGSQEAER